MYWYCIHVGTPKPSTMEMLAAATLLPTWMIHHNANCHCFEEGVLWPSAAVIAGDDQCMLHRAHVHEGKREARLR
jgi:hypothetical protein